MLQGLPQPARFPMLIELDAVGAVKPPSELTRIDAFGEAPAIAFKLATPCAVGMIRGLPVSSPLMCSHCEAPNRYSLFLITGPPAVNPKVLSTRRGTEVRPDRFCSEVSASRPEPV